MPYSPTRRLEAILSRLIPPSTREHVLGDLAEFTRTRREYLTWFGAIFPAVVFSETKRKLQAGTGVGLMAGLSAVALVIAALATRGRALATGNEWLHWVAPWSVWVTGCAIAAAYGPAGSRLWSGWGVLVALLAAIGIAAIGSGAHAAAVAAAIFAAALVHMGLTLPKLTGDLARHRPTLLPLTLDNLDAQARTFQRTIWWRNARESSVGVVLIAINGYRVMTSDFDSAAMWLSPALAVAGLAVVLYMLHVKAGSRRVPDGLDSKALLHFHRGEIARQRDMLRAVPWWYLLPLAPGIVAGTLAKWDPVSTPLALLVVGALFYGIARLNAWGARWLDGKLAEAQGLGG
jgi:hypothetical protein